MTINSSGQIAVGAGSGFGSPTRTVYSTETNLNDGDFHLAVMTKSGSNLGISIDGNPIMNVNDASTSSRAPLDFTIGMLQTTKMDSRATSDRFACTTADWMRQKSQH